MSEQVQYITNQDGVHAVYPEDNRVGVVLDWSPYSRLTQRPELDEDRLVGLSIDELTALASCKLAVAEQNRLDELITRNAESSLSSEDLSELDELLAKADQLTILKTRARYTLKHLEQDTPAA
ncbi:MAG: hypothetical protein ACFB4J_18615 [Elainellaceae cyanobacterium]